MKFFFLCLLLCCSIVLNAADDFSVKVEVPIKQISIQDKLIVNLDFVFPAGYEVDIDALQQNIERSSNFYGHPLAMDSLNVSPIQTTSSTLTQQIQMTLQPLQLGTHPVAFYEIAFLPQDKKNKKEIITSDIFYVDVLPIQTASEFEGRLMPLLTFSKTLPVELDRTNLELMEGQRILHITEEIDEEQMAAKRFPWIPIFSLFLIGLILWIFIRVPHIKAPLTPEQISQLAKQKALSDLKQLKSQDLPAKGFFEEFYVQLTEPVRAYIEKRYQVPTSTRTTPEFLSETAQNPHIPGATRQQLGQFLSQADKVKFGLYRPSLEECHRAEDLAIQFIESDKL